MRPINCLVIHHSASPTGSVEAFRKEHLARGWSDVGYHAIIGNGHGMPDGSCQQGRPDAIKGSAVYGANTGKLHVCLVGQFAHEAPGYCGPTEAQLNALGKWLLLKGRKYGVVTVKGHKEAAIAGHGTLCPGELNLDRIREWFGHRLSDKGNSWTVTLGSYLALASVPAVGSSATPSPSTVPSRVVLSGGAFPTVELPGLISEGSSYVRCADLATAAGWTVQFDPLTKTSTLVRS